MDIFKAIDVMSIQGFRGAHIYLPKGKDIL